MIDTSKNFERTVNSRNHAFQVVRKLANQNNLPSPSMTSECYGRRISCSYGENSLFSFKYDGDSKRLSVTYKDGRGGQKETKYPFYYIWVEGLSAEDGEKISAVTENGFEYSTNITESIRIKKADKERFKELMRENGIADWVINGNTFIPTSYAPKGTLYKF